MRRGLARDDSGQLMLLAGIVITLAFLLTALTLSQVSSLEREAAAEKSAPLSSEWRFLHERLAVNLESAVTPDLKLQTFKTTTFPIIANTFRSIEAEKGFDTVIRLADDPTAFNKTEASASIQSGGVYNAWSSDGSFRFTAPADDDDGDGVIWYEDCPDDSAPNGCIVGVLVFIHITDSTSTMSEVVLFAVNVE